MTLAFLGIGSNLGDRLLKLRAAVHALLGHPSLRIDLTRDVASLYETIPIGGPPDQPPYLNSVLRVQTSPAPSDLLAIAQSVESSLGRTRSVRWEPRVVDIDLLFFGDLVIDSPALTLPHPRMHERRFVLEPLSELAADLIHPQTGVSIETMTERLRCDLGTDLVMRIAGPKWVLDSAVVYSTDNSLYCESK